MFAQPGSTVYHQAPRTSPFSPISTARLTCPSGLTWNDTAAVAALRVKRANETQELSWSAGGPLRVDLRERWDRLLPAAFYADASSPRITLFGAGFLSPAAAGYQLAFFSPKGSPLQQNCSVLPGSGGGLLVFEVVPAWNGTAALATLNLSRAGVVVAPPRGGSLLSVDPVVRLVTPSVALAASPNGSVLVTFSGAGFDPSGAINSSCLLQGPPAAAGTNTTARGGVCAARNFTVVECSPPAWPHASPTSTVALLAGERLVDGTGVFENPPRATAGPWPGRALSGTPRVVTVAGEGFREAPVAYQCRFRLGPSEDSTPAVRVNNTLVTCPSPSWPFAGGEALLRVQETARTDRATQELPFGLDAEALSVRPSQGPVTGQLVAVLGSGFVADRPYQCVVSAGASGAHSEPSLALNASCFFCHLPFWESENQSVVLTFREAASNASTPNASVAGALGFQYLPVVAQTSPSQATAPGGAAVNISGCCFFPGRSFRALFFREQAQGQPPNMSACVAAADLQRVDKKLLTMQSPVWPLASQVAWVYVSQAAHNDTGCGSGGGAPCSTPAKACPSL